MQLAKQQAILGLIKALAPSSQAQGYAGRWQQGNFAKANAIIISNFNSINSPAIYGHICYIMQWASLCVCYNDLE